MWFLYVLTSGLVITATYLITSTIINGRRALEQYKRRSNGLPILPDAKPLMANHGVEFHLGRNVCNKLTKWHETYGRTFGFLYGTRPCASTIDLDLIKLFIVDEPQQHINRMPFHSGFQEFEHDGIFMAEGEQWRRIRRAFGPALKKFKMPSTISEIEESCQNLIDSIEKKLSNAAGGQIDVEVDNLTHRHSMDLVYRCLFKQSNLIDYNADKCQLVETVDEALRSVVDTPFLVRLCLVFPRVAPIIHWATMKFTKLGQWHFQVMSFIEDQTKQALLARKQLIEMRKRQSSDSFDSDNFTLSDGTQFKRSVTDFIIDQYLDGKLTRKEYFNSSFLLFNAADRTVADAMAHLLYLLATNQQAQAKLRESIYSSGMDSQYLMWVINESLRLHPPATVGCSRTISRDIKLAEGYTLPAGTYVHTPLYTIHRHKAYWGEDAAEFRPERWEKASEFHPMQFIPFGGGIRSCPGKELALYVMKMLLTNLLTRYKLECQEKDDIGLFDSPYTLSTLAYSETFVKFAKL